MSTKHEVTVKYRTVTTSGRTYRTNMVIPKIELASQELYRFFENEGLNGASKPDSVTVDGAIFTIAEVQAYQNAHDKPVTG